MRKLSLVNTLLFLLNSIFAAVLLLSYIYPYISPKSIPSFTILSLFVPTLIIINTFFFAYWLIRLKKQYFLSFLALLIGWFISSPVYKVFGKYTALDKDLKVMTFNVRTFNYDGWNEDKSLNTKAFKFITEKKPDIIAFQEFYESDKISFSYPYKFIKTKSKANKFGLAIYSKYKILNSGSLDFKKSANNIIFADVLKEEDTIRIYNVHLESLRINPKKENFGQKNSKRLFHRLSKGFKKQAAQTKLFLAHEKQWKGKKIVCGDFNNTAYSWVYKQISNNKKDAFLEAGKGFGKTFDYLFPLRIDFILTDKSATINHFKTFSVKYSDHFPIFSRIHWAKKITKETHKKKVITAPLKKTKK